MGLKNCWEVVQCGREENCPAYPAHGKTCFVVTNTLCRGEEQGSYEDKIEKCRMVCSYYHEIIDDVRKKYGMAGVSSEDD